MLGNFNYWCTLSFSSSQELCNTNTNVHISFRWRNNLATLGKLPEVAQPGCEETDLSNFRVHTFLLSPHPLSWPVTENCRCCLSLSPSLHVSSRRKLVALISGLWPHCKKYGVCSQVPCPKNVVRRELFHLEKPSLESKSSASLQSLQMGPFHYLPWKGDKVTGLASLRTCRCFLRPWEQFCFLPALVAAGNLAPGFCSWECQQPPQAQFLEIALK